MLLYFFPSYSIYHFLQKTEFPPLSDCQKNYQIHGNSTYEVVKQDTIGDAIAGEEQEEEEEDPEGGA